MHTLPLYVVGVMAMEASIVDLKDLRPAFLRLLPSFKQAAEVCRYGVAMV